jgi:hypothetical protein
VLRAFCAVIRAALVGFCRWRWRRGIAAYERWGQVLVWVKPKETKP